MRPLVSILELIEDLEAEELAEKIYSNESADVVADPSNLPSAFEKSYSNLNTLMVQNNERWPADAMKLCKALQSAKEVVEVNSLMLASLSEHVLRGKEVLQRGVVAMAALNDFLSEGNKEQVEENTENTQIF